MVLISVALFLRDTSRASYKLSGNEPLNSLCISSPNLAMSVGMLSNVDTYVTMLTTDPLSCEFMRTAWAMTWSILDCTAPGSRICTVFTPLRSTPSDAASDTSMIDGRELLNAKIAFARSSGFVLPSMMCVNVALVLSIACTALIPSSTRSEYTN